MKAFPRMISREEYLYLSSLNRLPLIVAGEEVEIIKYRIISWTEVGRNVSNMKKYHKSPIISRLRSQPTVVHLRDHGERLPSGLGTSGAQASLGRTIQNGGFPCSGMNHVGEKVEINHFRLRNYLKHSCRATSRTGHCFRILERR